MNVFGNSGSVATLASHLSTGAWVSTLALLLYACSSQPQIPFSYTLEPLSFEPGNTFNVTDGRARFREIFCAAN